MDFHSRSLKPSLDTAGSERLGPPFKLRIRHRAAGATPRQQMLCRAVFCLPSPHSLAPLPRHPRTSGTARRRRLAGERRAAEGGAIQAGYIHRSCPVGGGAHLQLDPAQPAGSPDPATDAAAQRHRSLEHDAQNRLATLSAAGALMNLSDDCWTATTSFANVVEVAINR